MRIRTTLILLVVVIIVGAYIAFVESKQPSTPEALRQVKRIVKMKAEDVEKLEINKGEEKFAFKREDDKWLMTEPPNVRADKASLDSVLSRLEFAEKKRTLTDVNPADYGLDKPVLTVSLWIKGEEKPVEIKFGKETEVGASIYAQVEGENDVLVVNKSTYTMFDKSLEDWRDKKVLDFATYNVEKFQLEREDGKYLFAKSGDKWMISSPIEARADTSTIDGMLDKLRFLRVTKFVSESPADDAKYSLDKPSMRVSVWEEDKAAQVAIFGKKGKENDQDVVYAKVEGYNSILAVRAGILDDLSKSLEEMRDKKLVRLIKADVEKIEMKKGGQDIVLSKEKDEWKLEKPLQDKAETSQVRKILDGFVDAEIKKFVADGVKDFAKYGFGDKSPWIAFSMKDGKSSKVIFGNEIEDGVCARVEGEKSVYLVDKDVLELLPTNPLDLKDRLVLQFDTGDVEEISIKKGESKVLCRKEGDTWKLVEPEGESLDEGRVEDILWAVSYLRAKKFVGEGKELDKYGLAQPQLELVVKALSVGDKAEGGYFAIVDGGGYVFLMDVETADTLMAPVFAEKEKETAEEKGEAEKAPHEEKEETEEQGKEGQAKKQEGPTTPPPPPPPAQ